jgi:molecular chaperone DnaK (HSP70)
MNSRDKTIRYGIPLADSAAMDRWREEGEAHAQERARAEKELRREQQTDSLTQLRADFAAEIEAVRMAQQECLSEAIGQVSEAVGQALEENAEASIGCIERAVKKVHDELFGLIERRFGELTGRVDALVGGGGKPRAEKFRSASGEKPVHDLPNPLPRRAVN